MEVSGPRLQGGCKEGAVCATLLSVSILHTAEVGQQRVREPGPQAPPRCRPGRGCPG